MTGNGVPRLLLLRSTIFRLALGFAVFFWLSVTLLLAFVYLVTVREMENEIRHRVNAQISQMEEVLTQSGLEGVRKQILEFNEEEGAAIYVLATDQGRVVVGNMDSWPEEIRQEGDWLEFDIESKSEASGRLHMLARQKRLADGYRLLVGHSLRGPDRARTIVLDAVTVSAALAVLITILGSMLFSAAIRRRLDQVSHVCVLVMADDFNVKAPVSGSNDAFDHLAQNVNAMLARIAELVRGLRQTSDNIAHDMRTPLGRHRIRLEALAQELPPSSRGAEDVKAGVEEIDNILETLNAILRISQAQSGVASGHFAQFDFSASVEDVADFYADMAEDKGIVLQRDIMPAIQLKGDKALLTQSVANLLDNAIKYTPEGGCVTISLAREPGAIQCVVADNGPGIAHAYLQKVRERFFRMEASRTSPGTGLGLSLVDAVAHLHRGSLLLSDNQPGLRAVLRLPQD